VLEGAEGEPSFAELSPQQLLETWTKMKMTFQAWKLEEKVMALGEGRQTAVLMSMWPARPGCDLALC